jgi:hypothetical protein
MTSGLLVGVSTSMKLAIESLLEQRATVYARVAGGGYTSAVKSGLACYLDPTNRIGFGAATTPQRAEPAPDATLYWAADYEMPEYVQVAVDASIMRAKP